MSLPKLDDLLFQPTEEVETAIKASIPVDLSLTLRFATQWEAKITNADGDVLWSGYNPDRRTLLFDVYGYFLEVSGAKPRHPVWERRGEVQIPVKYGKLAYQGNIQIPDPEDLDSDEIRKVYGLPLKKDTSK